ncbi:elongin-A-like [Rhinophrynus dorsalis]
METETIVQKVQRLKERLGHAQDPRKISKALKSLQELDISLDILVETGIGKTVNSFRRHSDVGEVAKSIVLQWKKLVPEDRENDQKSKSKHDKAHMEEKKTPAVSLENSFHEKIGESKMDTKMCVETISQESSMSKKKPLARELKPERAFNKKEQSPDKPKSHTHSRAQNDPEKGHHKCVEKKMFEKHSSSSNTTEKEKKQCPKDKSMQPNKDNLVTKGNASDNCKKQDMDTKTNSTLSDEDFEAPTMSFESYLNYDQISNKRKKRSCPSNEPPKKIQICKQYCNVELSKEETVRTITNSNSTEHKLEEAEFHLKEVNNGSLSDLLNVPLPKFLPDYAMLPSPPYKSEYKASISDTLTDQNCDSSGFTGRRLNSKMLVYSGSKIIYLPKMMTLYEQCIRVLQNNIDFIQEVGGVPFEILKPVLERCTPEQLSRIEECNPTFIEDSGHLWKKHCEKDFKNHKLLEYESWREMYMRLFSEREEKLRMITQNISSAHSGKPKGRQVKLAYIHSAAKPPRNIRRRQEIHGTAGPIVQPHPLEKLKPLYSGSFLSTSSGVSLDGLAFEARIMRKKSESVIATMMKESKTLLSKNIIRLQKSENKEISTPVPKQSVPSNTSTAIANNSHGGGPSQDPKKAVKRVAPMMAKSMRAFKNRVGPR